MSDCAWLPDEEEQRLMNQRRGWRSKKIGETFEQIIAHACEFYREQGTAEIEKTPEPMRQLGAKDRKGQFRACYQKRAQPDFKGTLDGGASVVFEAKHTDSDRILQSVITKDQWERLDNHWMLGAFTFVLVSIELRQFFNVPWEVWRDMEKYTGHKHMKLRDLEPYRIAKDTGVLRFLEYPVDLVLQDHKPYSNEPTQEEIDAFFAKVEEYKKRKETEKNES